MLEYQKIKTFLQGAIFPNSSEELLSDLKGEKIVETFYEKELQKTNQKEFRVEKVIRRKGDKLYAK